MKTPHIVFVFGILTCLSSCSKDNNEPYKPYVPTEWQYDKYSDAGILPGDDFYRFVCGKGITTEGSDSWAPHPRWIKQESDYLNLAFSNGDDNPVPVFKRLNELKSMASSEENKAIAFNGMRERLNGIKDRTNGKDLLEKKAEYIMDGYSLCLIMPMPIEGHKFGIKLGVAYEDMLGNWTEQQLELAGIKDEYNKLLPKARIFEQYLLDNITDDGESIDGLDAGVFKNCRQLKEYVESHAVTKAGSGAFERFASTLGNHNPDFVPASDATKQFFELVDKMDAEMKEAADAFLWCAAVNLDMDLILNVDSVENYLMSLAYPNLVMNTSHYFCDMYAKPECAVRNKGIFEALRSAMAERIEQSEWLSPYTKAGAIKKLDAMECHTGILDWSRYEADMPASDDFCSAIHEIGRSYVSKLMAISGENSELDHIIAANYIIPFSGLPPYSANSLYLPSANTMCILPSSFLLMDMSLEFPLQMYLISHEMCHGFDANGANYNERGELDDWWLMDDKLVFKEKQDRLISIFNRYHVVGTTFCNGAKTTLEDMADLGGLEIAYYATVKELEEIYTGEDLLEMKRRFFKYFAVYWAKYSSLEDKIEQVEGIDLHSPYEYRVNGIVNHMDDWYQLFDVTEDNKFYLSPELRVHLW